MKYDPQLEFGKEYPAFPGWEYKPIDYDYDLYVTIKPKYYDTEQYNRLFEDKSLSITVQMTASDRYKVEEEEPIVV